MPPDTSLRRHILLIVAVKLVALFALWWFFVRGMGLSFDSEGGAHLPTPAGQGAPHGQ